MRTGLLGWALAAGLLLACAERHSPGGEPASADIQGSRALAAAARERGVSFRALGNEPGWLLELGPEATLLVWDTGARRDSFPLPESGSARGGERVLETANARHRLRIRVTPGPCHDAMSGERFADRVEVRLDEEPALRGCGESL